MEKEIECEIHGNVQAVGYRMYVQKKANELEIYGYVKNYSDGSVEVVAQGEEEDLMAFITYLKKGPVFARVDEVMVEWHESTQDSFTDFSIEHE